MTSFAFIFFIYYFIFGVLTPLSAISWRPVLVVEEVGVPGENHNHGQATGKLYHLRLRVECTLFCHLQSRARTHTILVTGLYELLGNPTTKLIEPPGPFPLPLSNRKYNIIKEKIGLKLCQKYIVHYFNMS